MVDELGGERSMRRRGRIGGVIGETDGGETGDGNEQMEEGEGSTMDIEDD